MERLFISDLDGTLLQPNAILSPYASKQLKILLDQGIHFSVATGRSVVSIREIMGHIPIKLPVVASNGAYISDFATGRHQHVHHINPQICGDLLAHIRARGFSPFVSTYDGNRDHLNYDGLINLGMEWYHTERMNANDRRLKLIRDWKPVLKQQIVSFNVIERTEKVRDLYQSIFERFGEHLHMHIYDNEYEEGWCWFAIQDLFATKARGIEILLDLLGYNVDQVTVFGDNLNDLSMFQYVPHAVAVANAHPDLKVHAKDIIDHHETDSVIAYIKKMLVG